MQCSRGYGIGRLGRTGGQGRICPHILATPPLVYKGAAARRHWLVVAARQGSCGPRFVECRRQCAGLGRAAVSARRALAHPVACALLCRQAGSRQLSSMDQTLCPDVGEEEDYAAG